MHSEDSSHWSAERIVRHKQCRKICFLSRKFKSWGGRTFPHIVTPYNYTTTRHTVCKLKLIVGMIVM